MTKKKKHFELKGMKFTPKHSTSLLFFLLLGVSMFLFLGRKTESIQLDFLLGWMPSFYQHISNFSLSYLLFAGIGYFWLMMGVRFLNLVFFGIAIILGNLIYEIYIPILNTIDIVDAYFGIAGTLLGFLFLLYVRKFGLDPKVMDSN